MVLLNKDKRGLVRLIIALKIVKMTTILTKLVAKRSKKPVKGKYEVIK